MTLADPAREAAIAAILAEAGLAGAVRAPLAGDASTRRYERLVLGERRAILMDAPPKAESAPCPPHADAAERARLGYNAEARLAASRVEAFVTIADHLASLGLSGPAIHAVDLAHGLCVLEDFGEGLYFDLLGAGEPPLPLYESAVDALARLHETPAAPVLVAHGAQWPLLDYDRVAFHVEVGLMIDWFAPRILGRTVPDEARASWRAAWDEAFGALDGAARVLCLRDFHSPNLMWLPQREGFRRAGLLDFQDGLAGHPAFDLVSLLEDARRDVDPALAEAMLARYLERAAVPDQERFRAAYAVLGAERNAKIAGIFARLAFRDGKTRYLAHMPRVLRYLRGDLAAPALAPVAAWFAAHLPPDEWTKGEAA